MKKLTFLLGLTVSFACGDDGSTNEGSGSASESESSGTSSTSTGSTTTPTSSTTVTTDSSESGSSTGGSTTGPIDCGQIEPPDCQRHPGCSNVTGTNIEIDPSGCWYPSDISLPFGCTSMDPCEGFTGVVCRDGGPPYRQIYEQCIPDGWEECVPEGTMCDP